MTEPTAVDNSGGIARLDIKPQSFKLPYTTFHDMVVKYTAFDYDGNVAICEFNITVAGKFTRTRMRTNFYLRVDISNLIFFFFFVPS